MNGGKLNKVPDAWIFATLKTWQVTVPLII